MASPPTASKRKRSPGARHFSHNKRARVPYSSTRISASSQGSDSYSKGIASPEPQTNADSLVTSTATISGRAFKEAFSDLQWFENRHIYGQNDVSTAESNNVLDLQEAATISTELQSPRSPPSSPLTEAPPESAATKRSPEQGCRSRKAPMRRRLSFPDTSCSSESTSSERLWREGKKSVHWPERDILDLNDPHRGVVTSMENIARFSYSVCCDHESMLDAFKAASEEVKNALRYLSPRTMRHIAHYLPDFYDGAFLSVARYFRDQVRDDVTLVPPNASRRRDLKKALLEFCALLQEDLVFCQDCEAVHYPELELKRCASRWGIAPIHGGSSLICFEHYQVVVKKARAGLPIMGNMWKSMKSRYVMHISPSVCVLNFWEPYIANQDRMLLRAQKWIIIPFSCKNSQSVIRDYMSSNPLKKERVLCRHMKEIFDYENVYDCATANVKLDKPERCEECALEFQVNACGLGSIGWAVVVTSWRDLGRCVSVYDPRIQAHFSEYEGFSFTLGHSKSRPRISPATYEYSYDFDLGLSLGEGDGQGSDATISDTNTDSNSGNQVQYAAADREDTAGPRGYIEDEEPECSDLPLGGIRDMFEMGEFDLDDCRNEEEFLRLLQCRARWSKKKKDEETIHFALMPRLKRWGGDIESVADLYPATDGRNAGREGVYAEKVDGDVEINLEFVEMSGDESESESEGESESNDDEVAKIEINSDENDVRELQAGRDLSLDPALLEIS